MPVRDPLFDGEQGIRRRDNRLVIGDVAELIGSHDIPCSIYILYGGAKMPVHLYALGIEGNAGGLEVEAVRVGLAARCNEQAVGRGLAKPSPGLIREHDPGRAGRLNGPGLVQYAHALPIHDLREHGCHLTVFPGKYRPPHFHQGHLHPEPVERHRHLHSDRARSEDYHGTGQLF